MSGWKFDELDMMIRQRLCDALLAAGRTKEAGEALLNIINFFDETIYMAEPIVTWLTGRLCWFISPLCIRFAQQIPCNNVSLPKTAITQSSPRRP